MIVSDAMSLRNGKPAIVNPQFTPDLEQAERDMEKLLSLGAETIIYYHGAYAEYKNERGCSRFLTKPRTAPNNIVMQQSTAYPKQTLCAPPHFSS